jgi:hypothetical protein
VFYYILKAERCTETRQFWRIIINKCNRMLQYNITHYRIRISPPLDPVMRQMNSVLLKPFLMIHFNIILPSTPRSSMRSLPFNVLGRNPAWISHPCYVCHISDPFHYPRFDHLNVWCRVKITKLLITQFFPASYLLGPNIFSVFFFQTPSIYPALIVKDQGSHLYKTTGKTTVLYMWIFQALRLR